MKVNKDKKVYVAMSGGVDSSVAALWAKRQDCKVVGVYIKTWSPPGWPCPQKEDKRDAMRVCAQLGIAFKSWDFTQEYKSKVADYMVGEYKNGRTPNPDVMCNREIKFGLFFEKALKEGADYIATGHYARIERKETGGKKQETDYKLLKARDLNKDQSYFLWTLTQRHLARTLFPIGEFGSKQQLRDYAKSRGLATWNKKDSQGVCFVGPINVQSFLKERINASPGPVVSVTGRRVGEHTGLPFYTIGQRRGIGSGGGPYYVAGKEFNTNTLVVSPPSREEALMSRELVANDVNWIGVSPRDNEKIEAAIRYRQEPVGVRITNQESRIRVVFNQPVRAITPGQSVVFYNGESVLGGGIID